MKKKRPTQINLMIRFIAAMYLIYLAHGLISELESAENPKLMVGFAIAFTFVGVLIIAFTIKALVNHEYVDMNEIEKDEGNVIDEFVKDDYVADEGKETEEADKDDKDT